MTLSRFVSFRAPTPFTSHLATLDPSQNWAGKLSFFDARGDYVLGQINGQIAPVSFGITTTSPHTVAGANATISGDGWVQVELEVNGADVIRHFINGALAMEYRNPQLDIEDVDGKRLHDAGADLPVDGGYISLQSESHPVQFRNIRLLPLE